MAKSVVVFLVLAWIAVVASRGGCPMGRNSIGLADSVASTIVLEENCINAGDTPPVGNFGRIFPDLPPFAAPSAPLTLALLHFGAPGGYMDAKDNLSNPVTLITDPTLRLFNPDNPTQTAGQTFFGQFVDHDLTFDLTSRLGVPKCPNDAHNARTPRFDLDTVYGAGFANTYDGALYTGNSFNLQSGGLFEDLPRDNVTLDALIPDDRNDENLIISGLHIAFMKFHNAIVNYLAFTYNPSPADSLREAGYDHQFAPNATPSAANFTRARRLATWHYQWIVVNEHLPKILGSAMVNDILTNGAKFFNPKIPFIPVEFQGACYRFGHSQVRPSYRANLEGNNLTGLNVVPSAPGFPAFFGLTFDNSQNGQSDPSDMRGGARAPRRFIDWQTFFLFDDPTSAAAIKQNKLIDTVISTPLFNLTPGVVPGIETQFTALPQRNLMRQLTWSIPSGQAIALAMGLLPLDPSYFPELAQYRLGLDSNTPLWYYILKEAQVLSGGHYLGPVGGRIVGEVIMQLLWMDPTSYLNASPPWKPSLPIPAGSAANAAAAGGYRTVDLLTFAGVDPASRAAVLSELTSGSSGGQVTRQININFAGLLAGFN